MDLIFSAICLSLGAYAVATGSALRGLVAVMFLLLAAALWMTAQGAGLTGAVLVWVLGGGAGMFVVLVNLSVNLGAHEIGRRRLRIGPGLYTAVVIYVAAAGAGLLLADQTPLTTSAPFTLDHGAIALSGIGIMTLAASLAVLLLMRRRT